MRKFLKSVGMLVLCCAFLLLGGCVQVGDEGSTDAGKVAEAAGRLQVTMLDVGQGDAILIRTESKTVLMDTGDDKYYESAKKSRDNTQLFEALQRENVVSIDTLVLTHAHADHIGKADAVMERYGVRELVYNGIPSASKYFVNALKAAKAHNVKQIKVQAGDVLDFGDGAAFEVLSPSKKLIDADTEAVKANKKIEANNESVVGKLTFGSFAMLFTGDAETPIEKDLVATYGSALQSEVLKAGHHGSKTSSSADFLKAVQPEVVLISVGEGNQYGHPHEAVLNRYTKQGIKKLYRTDINGNVTIVTDGRNYSISKEK